MSDEDDLDLNDEDLDNLDDEDLDGLELDEDDLKELEKFEKQLEETEDLGQIEDELIEEEEQLLDKETSGNLFIGALKGKIPLLLKMEEEVENEKKNAKPMHGTQKYLINPFALKNPQDYEQIFDDINPEEPQMKVWRIEKFEPVPVPRERWGEFHSADCYIILYVIIQPHFIFQSNSHHFNNSDY